MIVTNVLDVPYTMLRESPQSNLTGNDRYFVDLVDAISKVLNFNYVLKIKDAGAYGSLVQTGTWNGIIGESMDGRAHIGAGAISITAERDVVKDSILLEYLCDEVLELSGDVCIQNKEKRITPRHIKVAIENDVELKELLKDVTIAEGGAMPFIHPNLLPKSD